MINYYCPVCRRPVRQTHGSCIYGHFDKALNVCPASFEPWRIALRCQVTRPKKTGYSGIRRDKSGY